MHIFIVHVVYRVIPLVNLTAEGENSFSDNLYYGLSTIFIDDDDRVCVCVHAHHVCGHKYVSACECVYLSVE